MRRFTSGGVLERFPSRKRQTKRKILGREEGGEERSSPRTKEIRGRDAAGLQRAFPEREAAASGGGT